MKIKEIYVVAIAASLMLGSASVLASDNERGYDERSEYSERYNDGDRRGEYRDDDRDNTRCDESDRRYNDEDCDEWGEQYRDDDRRSDRDEQNTRDDVR